MFRYKTIFKNAFIALMIVNMLYQPIYAKTPDLDISSESVVLIDAKTGNVLYGKNEHTKSYPASITKLLTALIAIENQKPTDIITLSKEAVYSIERGSSHIGLDVGEQITLDQGLHALLFASANESANGIAELCDGSIDAFARHATRRAKELGAKNSNFVNPHGLHDPNHYTTAYDMALISRELIQNPYFKEIMSTSTYQIPPTNKSEETRYLAQSHKLMNEARYGRTYREDVVGGKTGFTRAAGNTLVTMAKQGDVELIVVILKSNRANIYADTNTLLDYGFENYKSIALHQQENIVSSVPIYSVKSGQLIHVADSDVCVDECVNFLASSDINARLIDTVISLPPRLNKDVSIGDVVGTISYDYNGKSLSSRNLIVKNVNYLPSPEPVVFHEKPKFTIPIVKIPVDFTTFSTLLLSVVGLFGIILAFSIKHHNKLQRRNKKILKFSKTAK